MASLVVTLTVFTQQYWNTRLCTTRFQHVYISDTSLRADTSQVDIDISHICGIVQP